MRRPTTRTVLIAAGLFLLFLIMRFPYRNLRGYVYGQIFKTTQIRIDSEDLSPTFLGWPGVKLYNASISVPIGRTYELALQAQQLTARVGLKGFFPPVPMLSLYAYGFQKGGNLYVKGSRSGGGIHGSFQSEHLDLSQFLQVGVPEPVQGTMDAYGYFDYDTNELAKSTGTFDLKIAKLRIPGLSMPGMFLPALTWDEVTAKLAMKNGNLEIVESRLGTPKSDLTGTLTGYVRLGRDWPSSSLNITLNLKVSDAYRNAPQSSMLMALLNTYKSDKSPGEYVMKWSGTVEMVSMNWLPNPVH